MSAYVEKQFPTFLLFSLFMVIFTICKYQEINNMKELKDDSQQESDFIVRSYTKAELAQLYSPGREPGAALQNLYRWMRKCTPLTAELHELGYDKHRHSFLKREVETIRKHLGDP